MDVRDTAKIDQARDARQNDMRPKDKDRPKDRQSEFDRVLESSVRQPTKPMAQSTIQQATEQATREAKQKEERERDHRRREEGEKDEGRDPKGSETKREGAVRGEKIVAKGKLSDERGGSGGGEQGGKQPGGGGLTRRGIALVVKKGSGKAAPALLGPKFGDHLRASLKTATGSPRLAQEVLNKIVEYVRIGMNRKGEKEIQIDLHERIFRGLKLRVTSRSGKVGVHFVASDAKTRQLFTDNQKEIHAALSAKGIQVDEIVVS